MRGPTFIISSIALLMVARILFDNWRFVGGSNGVTLPQLDLSAQWIKLPYYYAFLAIMAVTVYASYRIKHSKFGLHLRAISQDEVKAESAGIDTRLYKSVAFAHLGVLRRHVRRRLGRVPHLYPAEHLPDPADRGATWC